MRLARAGYSTCAAILFALELRIGGEDHALSAKGEANLDFSAAPRASLALRSGQIDLDHWLASKGAPTGPQVGVSLTTIDVTPPVPLELSYDARGLAFAGEAFNDVSTTLAFGAGRAAWLRFEAFGPGKSRLSLDGAVQFGPAPDFAGKLAASAKDARRVANWLAAIAPQWALPRALPFDAIDLTAEAHIAPAQILLRDLDMRVEGSRFSGTLDYAPATSAPANSTTATVAAGAAARPSRLVADLVTPSLDIGALSNLEVGAKLSRQVGRLAALTGERALARGARIRPRAVSAVLA